MPRKPLEAEYPINIRTLDEWMYALHTALAELVPEAAGPEAVALLRKTLDDMRERRAVLLLQRQNEVGF